MEAHMPRPPFRDLGPQAQATARRMVDVTTLDPAAFRPAILAAQWGLLKAARGQSVDHDRLWRPAHIIAPATTPAAQPADTPAAQPADTFTSLGDALQTIVPRIRDRILARAAALQPAHDHSHDDTPKGAA